MQLDQTSLTAIILACIAAPGFWKMIEKLYDSIIGRKRVSLEEISEKLDSQQKDIDSLKQSVSETKGEEAEKEAKSARRRILRFNDELLREEKHSKEYFDDILEDLRIYDEYCRSHPHFLNGKTEMAEKNIKRCYELCMQKHSFLQY